MNRQTNYYSRAGRYSKGKGSLTKKFLTFYGFVFASTLFTIALFQQFNHSIVVPISVSATESKILPSGTPMPLSYIELYKQNKLQERQQVRSYIYKIFAKDQPSTAYAISLAEGGVWDKIVGDVVYADNPVADSSVEHSCGIFQINLSNDNQSIHADRIPGDNLNEKCEWLQNPYNNTLYAYWIYKTSGWFPWTTYQNGKYLGFIKK